MNMHPSSFSTEEFPSSSTKMHRIVLDARRRQELQGIPNIETTPLRGAVARCPRPRLLQKDINLEQVPIYSVGSSSTIISKLPFHVQNSRTTRSSFDRFIPSRAAQNFEASFYQLIKSKPVIGPSPSRKQECVLDVLSQVENISTTWHKSRMIQAMEILDVIPGIRQRANVLNFGQQANPGASSRTAKDVVQSQSMQDGVWKVKPRKKPLIGSLYSRILDMPSFPVRPHRRTVDWSSRNLLAAVLGNTISIFDGGERLSAEVHRVEVTEIITCLKFSNAGDKLAIFTKDSQISLYSMDSFKYLWKAKCVCSMVDETCETYNACWSAHDRYVVMGCTSGAILAVNSTNGSIIMEKLEDYEVIAMAFSANFSYLAISFADATVLISDWPSMTERMLLGHYVPIKSIAWHPWENGLLCLGSGSSDASISFYNVDTQVPMCCRLANFTGRVSNLLWNKISGELVVHWTYWENRKRFTTIVVMASADWIVDTLPFENTTRVGQLLWSPDHLTLAAQMTDTLVLWSFFGAEPDKWSKLSQPVKTKKRKDLSCLSLNNQIR